MSDPYEPAPPPGAGLPPGARPPGGPGEPGRPNPYAMLAVGLIVGIILGGLAGYFLFHGKNTAAPAPSPSASATTTATVTATATAPATSPPTPSTAAQGVVPCPVATPAGQHTLGSPGGPGAGQHRDASLDFCGQGSATIPAGSTRFTTGDNWGLGIADSCPQGSSGEGGMNTVLSVNELAPGGTQGPDTATEGGDWVDSGSVLMQHGGNYQLQVMTVSASCVWHIAVYPT